MDINKDIEILKNVCYDNDGKKMFYIDISSDECEEFIQAIENVLKELETYKRIANMKLDDREEIINNLCEHRCPIKSDYEEKLETYKKIAEKLAYEILLKIPFVDMSEENIKILIENVRKEVEND